MTETIRVLIVDDHAIVRQGLMSLLRTEPGMEVVGEAADGSEAILLVQSLRPDVVLLDLAMPKVDGVEATAQILSNNPEARVLILTTFAEDEQILSAMRSGAMGYLLKDASPDSLLQAIRDVHQGEYSLHPTVARKLMNELTHPPAPAQAAVEEPLTPRELDVLKLIAQGMSNQDIADNLIVSERTVGKHVGSILDKLGLENRTQAALFALREGLVSLS